MLFYFVWCNKFSISKYFIDFAIISLEISVVWLFYAYTIIRIEKFIQNISRKNSRKMTQFFDLLELDSEIFLCFVCMRYACEEIFKLLYLSRILYISNYPFIYQISSLNLTRKFKSSKSLKAHRILLVILGSIRAVSSLALFTSCLIMYYH